jgi:hypothetical protein
MKNQQSFVDFFRSDNPPPMPGAKIRQSALNPRQHPGVSVALLLAAFLFAQSGRALFAAPPPNDNFANRIALTAGVTAIGDTTNATIEPGEPTPRGVPSNQSPRYTVWYTWTASSDSMVSLDNFGSQIQDDYVAVYLGAALGRLVDVDYGYVFLTGGPGGRVRLAPFPVKAGTTLQIQAGSVGSGRGMLKLTLAANPFNHVGPLFGPEVSDAGLLANDNFINRAPLTGSALTAISYNLDATIEGGEPNRPFANVRNTVWFKWTAPATANVTIDTTGTTVSGHFFAVYAGDSIQTLATVAENSSSNTNATTDTFPVAAGTTYTISAGSTQQYSGTLVLTLTSAPAYTGSLLNLSTRMAVGTGNDVLIGGFILRNGPKKVVIRAIGPSLAQSGISNTLSDPFLELHDAAGTLITQNNNWQDDPDQAGAIQASGLAPRDPRESAVIVTLPASSYTAIIRGVNNTTGVALVEVYDTEGTAAPAKAVNVSTRGFVSTGNSVMIAGFIVGGSSPAYVIIRGIGPSLAGFGVINVLQNPVLELYDAGGHRLITIDNWQDVSNYGQVVAAGLAPSDSRECALSTFLDPGAYTAVLRGLNNTTGVGLVEVYNLLP